MIRKMLEEREQSLLCAHAMLSKNTKGREKSIKPCDYRTEFQRDRDRILHSKSFRRLKHKTQVFISPEGDHYRTRLTHTLEVAQIARTIARSLLLNEDLAEAVALGHDLGHTPFGHAGERALQSVCSIGFRHNMHSKRVVEVLENDGIGLNLTAEVIDGIACHTGNKISDTLEGVIVHYADRIAYINHDIDDAIRAGIITRFDIPKHLSDTLGNDHGSRIDTMVRKIIEHGTDDGITLADEYNNAMLELRQYMFDNVYTNPIAKSEEGKAVGIICTMYEYFYKNIDKLPENHKKHLEFDSREQVVCDFIASMTDRYAVARYEMEFIPKNFTIL